MVNYENSVIYKIKCRITGEVYFGSTCQSLARRMNKHRSGVKDFDNGKTKSKKCTSYDIIKRGDYEVTILEKFPTTEKFLLNQRERHYIESEECLNKVIPTRTLQEYEQTDRRKDVHKSYEKSEKGIEGRRIRNASEKGKERNRTDYLKSKEAGKCEIITCECGGSYNFRNKVRHCKTIKHQEFIKEIQFKEK